MNRLNILIFIFVTLIMNWFFISSIFKPGTGRTSAHIAGLGLINFFINYLLFDKIDYKKVYNSFVKYWIIDSVELSFYFYNDGRRNLY